MACHERFMQYENVFKVSDVYFLWYIEKGIFEIMSTWSFETTS